MPKKRKPNKPELESQEMPKVKVEDRDSDFDMEDDVSEDDGDLFDSMSIKDDGADMLMDEPDEDDLDDFDEDDLMSDIVSLDAAALADCGGCYYDAAARLMNGDTAVPRVFSASDPGVNWPANITRCPCLAFSCCRHTCWTLRLTFLSTSHL